MPQGGYNTFEGKKSSQGSNRSLQEYFCYILPCILEYLDTYKVFASLTAYISKWEKTDLSAVFFLNFDKVSI